LGVKNSIYQIDDSRVGLNKPDLEVANRVIEPGERTRWTSKLAGINIRVPTSVETLQSAAAVLAGTQWEGRLRVGHTCCDRKQPPIAVSNALKASYDLRTSDFEVLDPAIAGSIIFFRSFAHMLRQRRFIVEALLGMFVYFVAPPVH
jgi:hypothetical protein